MKLSLIALLLFLLPYTPALAQVKGDVSAMLNGKWEMVAVEMDGEKAPMPPGKKGSMQFKGKQLLIVLDDETSTYNWTYNSSSKVITAKNAEETVLFKVDRITEKDLVLSDLTEKEHMVIYLEKEN